MHNYEVGKVDIFKNCEGKTSQSSCDSLLGMLTTSTDLEQTFLMLGVLKQSLAGRKSGVLSPSDVLVSDNTHMEEFHYCESI